MDQTEIKIAPVKGIAYQWKEVWENRELLYFFAWRDIKVKYKQTSLGILWAVLQPLLMMVFFYFVFARGLKIQTGSLPYPVYAFSGLMLWSFFSSGIGNSSESMVGNANIIRKVYFPRLIIPLSSLLVAFIDFVFCLIIFAILLLAYRQPVNWTAVICFPLGILMTLLSSFGIGTWLSALNVKYRDFRYLLPFAMQLLFFSSQIVYSIHGFENTWLKYLLFCHPFNGALEVFNYPLQPGVFDPAGVGISVAVMLLLLVTGLLYFKKTEAFFADLL
jgi:lipopolysaccharide transport system permease protein